MIKGVMLAWSGYSGGAMGDMFAKWEQAGVFSYMLPFLLIFAVVFGILTQTKIFQENKSINGIIALVVSLMALQFSIVSQFFSEIFPRLGIGLVVILIVMILLGMFAPDRTWVTYTFFTIAAIVLVVILSNVFGVFGWGFGNINILWDELLPFIVLIVLLLIIVLGSIKPKSQQDISSNFMKNLFQGGNS
jgi:hypothetical protein